MADYLIRSAEEGDAETLSHIGVATFVDSYTEIITGEAMTAHCTRQHNRSVYATYLESPDAMAWLAEYAETGAPIGYAVTCPPDLPVDGQPGDLELKRIYLLSRFHGNGAGRGLFDVAVDHARAAGAPRLLLGTYNENHRAIAFYRKVGFQQIGTRQFQVGDQLYDDIVMALAL